MWHLLNIAFLKWKNKNVRLANSCISLGQMQLSYIIVVRSEVVANNLKKLPSTDFLCIGKIPSNHAYFIRSF